MLPRSSLNFLRCGINPFNHLSQHCWKPRACARQGGAGTAPRAACGDGVGSGWCVPARIASSVSQGRPWHPQSLARAPKAAHGAS